LTVIGARGDPARLVADSKRAHDELGWAPERFELATIIEDAWRWNVPCLHQLSDEILVISIASPTRSAEFKKCDGEGHGHDLEIPQIENTA